MDNGLLVKVCDTIDNLLLELEHIQNVLGALEMAFMNNHYDDRDMEVSSLCVLKKYMENVRHEYADEISKIMKDVTAADRSTPHKNTPVSPCTSSMDES